MINRDKLEHILEYARQQRHIGQSCKVPPEDMVEIMERLLNAGNSLVIPDGYVMVPKEPTDEMLAAAKEWTGLTSTAEVVYIKMLAAAPQLPGSEPAAMPGKWIPVGERMPEDEEQYYLTYSGGDGVCRSYFFDGYFADQYITHWMPLPAAPQEVR